MLTYQRLIISELGQLLERVKPKEVTQLNDFLVGTPVIMGYANGRSGFLLRSFIMRLNHVGQRAYFVGDASTPPVRAGDGFLLVSGSGTTATSLGAAMEASKLGARIAAITGSRISPLGQLAEVLVELPAPHKRGVPEGGVTSEQAAGSLFEQSAFILLEGLIQRRYEEVGKDPAGPLDRHANVEA